jgi:hypothetical protein
MMRRARPVLLAVALVSCGRACGGGAAPDAGVREAASVAAAQTPSCRQTSARVLAAGRPVVVGGAARSGGAHLVGAVVGGGDGVLFRVEGEGDPEAVVVGALRGDAPAPLPLVDGDAILVAYRAAEGLVVRPLADREPLWRVALPGGADTGYDVAVGGGTGLAVFEEPHATGDAVKAAWLGKADAGVPLVLRAPVHDVESLRVVRAGSAYWVLWLARTLDVPDAEVVEGTRDREGPAFVEAVRLDDGALPGVPIALGPPSGRVTGFDVRATETGVEVLFRDASDGEDAARLVRVALSEAGAGAREILAEGVGRAAPAVVGAGLAAYVQLTDAAEHPYLLSLTDGRRIDVPVAEGLDARALGLSGSVKAPTLLVAVLAKQGAVELRTFACPAADAAR